jgi:hypothetical protein
MQEKGRPSFLKKRSKKLLDSGVRVATGARRNPAMVGVAGYSP